MRACLVICLIASIGGLFFSLQPQAQAQNTLKVAVNHAPPYRIINTEKAHYHGIYIDLLKELAQKTGFDVEFVNVPFKRALVLMEFGAADLMLGPNKTPEREQFMSYLSAQLPRERKVFYRQTQSEDIFSLEDLVGKTVGVLRGASYSEKFEQTRGINKIYFSRNENAFAVLETGRFDYVVMPELLGDYLLAQNGSVMTKATYTIEGRPSFFAVSRKSPFIARKSELEAALSALIKAGRLDEIIARYR